MAQTYLLLSLFTETTAETPGEGEGEKGGEDLAFFGHVPFIFGEAPSTFIPGGKHRF